jgi:hypothetical protein
MIFLHLDEDMENLVFDLLESGDAHGMWTKLEAECLSKRAGSRFNAYDHLISIRKKGDESLTTLGVRLSDAMRAIRNLRPAAFSIEVLDEELECMALIRALPDDYALFVSNFTLANDLKKETVLVAFKNEEADKRRRPDFPTASLSALAANASPPPKRKWPKKRQQEKSSSYDGPKSSCDFCKESGHSIDRCRAFLMARSLAQRGPQDTAHIAESSQDEDEHHSVSHFVSDSALLSSNGDSLTKWNADTGATSSMTPHRHYFHNYMPHERPIHLANGCIVHSEGIGSVIVVPVLNGQNARPVEFTGVLHVPSL